MLHCKNGLVLLPSVESLTLYGCVPAARPVSREYEKISGLSWSLNCWVGFPRTLDAVSLALQAKAILTFCFTRGSGHPVSIEVDISLPLSMLLAMTQSVKRHMLKSFVIS